MTKRERNFIFGVMVNCFCWMDMDDIEKIYNSIEQDVVSDIEECAHHEFWNDGDVKIAIKRVLLKRLGIDE